MAEYVHEWVENYKKYEAVFVCSNEIESWDTGKVIRNFSIYHWDNATIQGEALTFRHEPSAATIKYEGNVLAVTFGNGKLTEAFQDLFLALKNQGWRRALVYHKPETMDVLLRDIGNAIRAGMDFDVKAAKMGMKISDFPEAKSLGVKSNAGEYGSPDDAAIIESEMKLMVPNRGKSAILADDVGDHDDDEVLRDSTEVNQLIVKKLADVESGQSTGKNVVEIDQLRDAMVSTNKAVAEIAGMVTTLVKQQGVVPVTAENAPGQNSTSTMQKTASNNEALAKTIEDDRQLHDENVKLRKKFVELDKELTRVNEVLEMQTARIHKLVEDGEHLQQMLEMSHIQQKNDYERGPIPISEINNGLNRFGPDSELTDMSSYMIRVGASGFCFDIPGASLSESELKLCENSLLETSEDGTVEIKHCYPGMLNQGMRWNVFGDISVEAPWSAQNIAMVMGFSEANAVLVAKSLLELKQNSQSQPQLRDLLEMCSTAWAQSKSKIIIDEIVLRLGGLGLCTAGEAFVDVRRSENSFLAVVNELFCVSKLAVSAKTRLFVIHVDSLDGPFVVWQVDVLRAVVLLYSKTNRYVVEDSVPNESVEQVVAVETAEVLPVDNVAAPNVLSDTERVTINAMSTIVCDLVVQKLRNSGFSV